MASITIHVGQDERSLERQTGLEILPSGKLRVTHAGLRSTGEQNLAEVANLVVIILNEWGEGWSAPHPPSGPEVGADMIAHGPRGVLRLQVTRVPHDHAHWKVINADGLAERIATPDELAEDLIDAIRRKAARYPAEVRSSTMLVLDGQSGMYDIPLVLHAFTRNHLGAAQSSGFDDIFLVGQASFVNLLRPQLDAIWFSVA